ncbi:MAG: hypothetical protein HC796_02290 [Synechococcaceae cyanobacterium RL_1_2]|nr:hypothetical protein [Synechococcaceae cyanobacterium RL_1_2]
MGDFNCITVGINRYQFLQPLAYAQNDATSIADALVNYGRINREQVLILGDDVPWLQDRSTVPTKENFAAYLSSNRVKQESQSPQKIFWFFFSGYGVSVKGKDYVMFVDSDPGNLTTALAASELFQLLKQQGAEQIIAIFDINRSPGVPGTNPVGQEMVTLAKEMNIVTILSTEPEQYSHEASSLGHGVFTAALLEAINHHREELTLRHIDRYLKNYLPELSEHHWRPIQNPLIVTPKPEFASLKLIEDLDRHESSSSHGQGQAVNNRELAGVTGDINATAGLKLPSVPHAPDSSPLESDALEFIARTKAGKAGQDLGDHELLEEEKKQLDQLNNGNNISTTSVTFPGSKGGNAKAKGSKAQKTKGHNQLIMGAIGLFLLGLLASTLMKLFNGDGIQIISDPNLSPDNPGQDVGGETTNNPIPDNPDSSASSAPSSVASSSVDNTNPDSNIDNVKLPNINVNSSGGTENKPLVQNSSYRERARSKLSATQAYRFYDAIKEAQQVKSGDPDFAQAQQDIDRWSKVIIDISEGRAFGGNVAGAIAAGQLLDPSITGGYAAAQANLKAIKEAKGYAQVNLMIISTAKKQVIRNQASSYNKAIRILNDIKPNEPQYEAAQNLINDWSREIYLIANSRAAKKNFTNAITAAKLVPEGSNYYERAQSAVKRWEKGSI